MKKILFLLLGILCPLGIMAQDLTFGITRNIASESTTSSDGQASGYAVSNEELVGTNASSHVTLAKAHSANNSIMTNKGRNVYHGNDVCYVDKGIENVRSTTTTLGENYYAFTLTIEEGYSLSIKSISGDVCVDADKFVYKMAIADATGTEVYTSLEKKLDKKTNDGKNTELTSKLAADIQAKLTNMIGTVTVKMYWTNTAKDGKYCIIKDFNVTATVQEYQVEKVEITGSIEPENAGTISGIGKIVKGSDATLKATPNAGYKFSKWVIDGKDSEDNPYVINNVTSAHTVKAIFAPIPMITFKKGEGIGTVPETDYAEGNYALPTPRFLAAKGKTFIGWNDGTTTHPSGTTIEIKENTTLTAMFADNEVALGQEETVVDWTFARKEGAPLIKCEGNEIDYVATVLINDKPLDVVLHINGKNGKVNNSSDEKFAQVNKGTKFTIPAIKGMEITYPTNNNTPKPEDFSFNGEPATSIDGKVVKFTYNGNAETLEIVENTGNFYPSGIKVTYPKVMSGSSSTIQRIIAYTWSSKEGTVTEEGGTATMKNAPADAKNRVNYANGGYYTICLNGKEGNMNDKTPTDKSTYIEIAFKSALVAGDSIYVTAYRNNGDLAKKASIFFDYGKATVSDTKEYGDIAAGQKPTTHGYVIPEEAAGSKVLRLSRNYASTSLFIIKFSVVRWKKDNSDDFINVDNGGYNPENGLDPSDDFPTGSIESPTRPENGLITFPSDDTENADQSGAVTGIDNASAAASVVAIYTANGKRVNTLQKGLNIVTLSDGSRIKVIK